MSAAGRVSPRPHYGSAFRKRYLGCTDTRCYTLADHAEHDPHGPEHPDGYPVTAPARTPTPEETP